MTYSAFSMPPAARTFVTHHLPALAWAGLVAAALGAPSGLVPSWSDRLSLGPWLDPWFDKIIHFALFAVMAALAARSFLALGGRRRASAPRLADRWPLASAALVASAYGGLTELLQLRFGARSAEWADFAADVAGALVAVALVGWLRRRTVTPRAAADPAVAGNDGRG